MVLDNGVKKSKELLAAGNKAGAQAVLEVLDIGVVTEMEKALEVKLLTKEVKAAHDELQKALQK